MYTLVLHVTLYISGELGPPGRLGSPGKDGEPGINAWKVNINDYNVNDILIPPSIVGKNYQFKIIDQ